MIHQDRIYGKIKIEEPVILELIKSKSIQRLKDIDQNGYPPAYNNPCHIPISELEFNRFEHSLGVCCLLKKYNTPIEEQIAGLIHDVSHAAFSHCIDYVLDAGSEKEHSHQDNIFEKFVKNSEIPKILKKYNFDLNYILNENNFPILEKSLPDLCADRIDYSLRTAIIFKEINKKELDYYLNNLIIKNTYWVFRNFESAKEYSELFLKLNRFYYAGLPSAIMFRTVGDTLKYALNKKYISENDLYTNDKKVLDKIKKYLKNDEILNLLYNRMNNEIGCKEDKNNYDAHVFCKSRIVNPLFKEDGLIRRISERDKKWQKILKKEIQPKEYFIKFEK